MSMVAPTLHRSLVICTLLLGLFVLLPGAYAAEPALRDGDILFHTSRSAQSAAIQRATHSRYSHMGLVLHQDGKPFVLEAAATVKFTPLPQWIARGDGGHYVAKRWTEADTRLDAHGAARLRREALALQGKPYDLTFEWSDQRIYCSELVWKAYQRAFGVRLGETQLLRQFDLDTPVVKAKLRQRYGERIPLDETVISPAAMFDSDLLRTVVEH
ncbi:permuted papain-like amidase YaeF/Yiix C92 family enzyme [Tahibacter aquaticus]|uniref:Permuted papain-like amidase YaeF/Yiix C92 family enzyme n=1 Tax=Tahibacter aquaticus TaxID=520092 RepID=A0A4R6YST9_9GAMM|nr:YiiX family permuted papain-like enzyme [Tahibacter aquaticus]TDR41152.1 permuted papain-like amidase YaeF/Yiix C92 family enzyme [Tahibacter aquaticus]